MLRTLRIRDLVIIEDLTVEFGDGLNLLTGETGAGKSILLDALTLATGGRADRSLIRSGAECASVEALFELDGRSRARSWADERGFEIAEGGQLLVQRELPRSGNGRVRINGSPATVQLLRELGERVLELHGQHEQLELRSADRSTELLDAHGGHEKALGKVRSAWERVREAVERGERLREMAGRRSERIEELERLVREVEALAPEAGELEELDRERRLLQNAGQLSELLDEAVHKLYEAEPSAAGLAASAAERAEELARIDSALTAQAEQIRAAAVELQDAGEALRDYRDGREFDPERLEIVESRRAAIERLCLAHGRDEAGLGELLDSAGRELSELRELDDELEASEEEARRARERYGVAAAALSGARARAARSLTKAVNGQLRSVALAAASFEVSLRPTRGEEVEGPGGEPIPLAACGAEQAELLLAANPGEPARPLSQVASGGELSRVMLALHVVAGAASPSCSLVFDEVDAGVGGAVADSVGARLATLARSQQVLCVTHLPQVAAYADRHLRVRKRVEDGRTTAGIEDLSADGRVEELARMLGGKKPSALSRRHAAELLTAAERPRAGRRA